MPNGAPDMLLADPRYGEFGRGDGTPPDAIGAELNAATLFGLVPTPPIPAGIGGVGVGLPPPPGPVLELVQPAPAAMAPANPTATQNWIRCSRVMRCGSASPNLNLARAAIVGRFAARMHHRDAVPAARTLGLLAPVYFHEAAVLFVQRMLAIRVLLRGDLRCVAQRRAHRVVERAALCVVERACAAQRP